MPLTMPLSDTSFPGVMLVGPATAGPSSGAWAVANQGVFIRFRVSKGRSVTGIRLFNGGTAADNWKVGLYSSDLTTLTQMGLSNSTAQSGTNTSQDIAFTASQVIAPAIDYWAFVACDGTTGTIMRVVYVAGAIGLAMGTHAAVAATFVTPPTSQLVSGLAATSSGFCPMIAIY